jgi:hypothetical protein
MTAPKSAAHVSGAGVVPLLRSGEGTGWHEPGHRRKFGTVAFHTHAKVAATLAAWVGEVGSPALDASTQGTVAS